jgi:hypothetical protein
LPTRQWCAAEGYDWVAENLDAEAPPKGARDRARLHVRTAVGEHRFDLLGEWKVPAVKELIAALPERLRELGRGSEEES